MDPNDPVPLPDGFRLDDDGSERRISWRWISLRAVFMFFFVALWDGILAVALYGAFLGKAPPLPVLTLLLIVAGFGAGISYAAAAYLLNRTCVRVDRTRVSVRHGPLPWFGAKDVSRADIERVRSERHTQLDDDGGFEPQECCSRGASWRGWSPDFLSLNRPCSSSSRFESDKREAPRRSRRRAFP